MWKCERTPEAIGHASGALLSECPLFFNLHSELHPEFTHAQNVDITCHNTKDTNPHASSLLARSVWNEFVSVGIEGGGTQHEPWTFAWGKRFCLKCALSPWRPTRVTLCGSSSIACHGGPRRYVVSQAHNVHKQFQRHMLLVEARARLASRLFPVVVSRLVTDENVWCARDCS